MSLLKKKDTPLYIALAVPVFMIVLVAALVYIPSRLIHPQYKFVYSSGESYPYNNFIVRDLRLENNPQPVNEDQAQMIKPIPAPISEPKLYIYDPVTNESREVSLSDAEKFTLDSSTKSPDGYEVVQGNSDGGIFEAFFGGSRDYNTRYLTGHGGSKKINAKSVAGNYYDPYSFRFLGWIIPAGTLPNKD